MVGRLFSSLSRNSKTSIISAPLAGRVIPLSEVRDATFSDGSLGEGLAILPTGDRLVAPADAKIEAVFPTGHAVALRTDSGVDLLIHIGFNTVDLGGKHFKVIAAPGQTVKRGDVLVEFDRRAIVAEGYDITVPVLVRNSVEFSSIKQCCAERDVRELDDLMEVHAR